MGVGLAFMSIVYIGWISYSPTWINEMKDTSDTTGKELHLFSGASSLSCPLALSVGRLFTLLLLLRGL